MSKLYAVCFSLQEKEINRYCFKECGKIIVGELDFNNMAWCPCRTEDCKYFDRQVSFGEVPLGWGNEELIGRKLIPYLESPSGVEG